MTDAGVGIAFIVSDHPKGEFVFRPGKSAVSRCKGLVPVCKQMVGLPNRRSATSNPNCINQAGDVP